MAASADDVNRKEKTDKDAIESHQKALDDLVSVNSLLSVAVFVGLTFSVSLSLESRSHCKVSRAVAQSLLVYEVISFACFLLSSLVAKSLKMHLSTYLFSGSGSGSGSGNITMPRSKFLRGSMLFLSALSSIFGCLFLTISMVQVVQIRLGRLSCGHYAMRAGGGLIAIVSFALIIYIPFTIYAIYQFTRNFDEQQAT